MRLRTAVRRFGPFESAIRRPFEDFAPTAGAGCHLALETPAP